MLLIDIVENLNKNRKNKINPARKELEQLAKELDKLSKKKKKIYEAYEEEIIGKDEFSLRFGEIKRMEEDIQKNSNELKQVVSDENLQQIPYGFVKSIMENFDMLLKSCSTREQQKKLLHMIISEITINEVKEIDSIKLNINDSLVEYLREHEGVSIKDTPSSFILKNIGIKVLDLKIAV